MLVWNPMFKKLEILQAEKHHSVGEEGDLQICGQTVNMGYYLLPDENARSFTKDGWFVTGDRAMIRDNEIIITGRNKEIMIINGVNVSCIEVEKNIEELEEIQTGTVGCIADRNQDTSQDEVCIFYGEYDPELRETMKSRISQLMNKCYGFSYDYLVPIKADEIPRSNIGKIDKKILLKKLKNGELANVYASQKKQIPKWFVTLSTMVNSIADEEYKGSLKCLACTKNASVNGSLFCEEVSFEEMAAFSGDAVLVYEADENDGMGVFLEKLHKITDLKKTCRLILVLKESSALKSYAEGFAAALVTEHTDLKVRVVACDSESDIAERLSAEINDFCAESEKFAVILYRKGRRYKEYLTDISMLKHPVKRQSFRYNGRYILIGGTGGIGKELALHLLKNYRCSLDIVGRRTEAEVSDVLDELRKAGKTAYYSADAADADALSKTLEKINSEGQAPDGVFSLIGEQGEKYHFENYDSFAAQSLGKEDIERITRPRVGAAKAIAEFAKDRKDIDIVIFSSSAGLLGGQTYSVYSAVSRYLYDLDIGANNLFVYAFSKWSGLGMNRGETEDDRVISNQAGYFSIQPENGFASLEGLMQRDIRRAVVGVNLNNSSIRSFRRVRLGEELDNLAFYISYTADKAVKADFDMDVIARRSENEAAEEKVLSGEMEDRMLTLWKKVLKNPEVKKTDDFFEVGGNSLKIIKLVDSIRNEFGKKIAVSELFSYPSIRKLCNFMFAAGEDAVMGDVAIDTIDI